MICLILLVCIWWESYSRKINKMKYAFLGIRSIRHHNKLAIHHWKQIATGGDLTFSLRVACCTKLTSIKWKLRCWIVWRKGKGLRSHVWSPNYGTLTVNEINLVDITKIMISLRKAKPEWFSPSDIRQVIFANFYEIAWNLHDIKAERYQHIATKSAHKYSEVYRNRLGVLSLFKAQRMSTWPSKRVLSLQTQFVFKPNENYIIWKPRFWKFTHFLVLIMRNWECGWNFVGSDLASCRSPWRANFEFIRVLGAHPRGRSRNAKQNFVC